MLIHLVDGTYELFRHFYAVPPAKDADGREVAAVRGVVGSMLGMLGGRRHARRRGHRSRHRVVPQRALARLQDRRRHRAGAAGAVPPARRGARRRWASSCGRWWSSRPTTRWRPRRRWRPRDPRVERVLICTPDKDLAQCVSRRRASCSWTGARAQIARRGRRASQKFGVPPASIPDYLALVGDCRRRLPGPAGLGRQVGGGGAGALRRTSSQIPRSRVAVGRDGARRRGAGGDARRAARAGDAVPHAGDAAPRRADRRRRRRAALARPGAGVRGDRGRGSASPACSRGRRRCAARRLLDPARKPACYCSLVARALVPAAQMMPLAFAYIARSTTTWAGVAPSVSISAP